MQSDDYLARNYGVIHLALVLSTFFDLEQDICLLIVITLVSMNTCCAAISSNTFDQHIIQI